MTTQKARNPCAPGCPDRAMHSHAACQRYAAYAAAREREREQEHRQRQVLAYIIDCQTGPCAPPLAMRRNRQGRGGPR